MNRNTINAVLDSLIENNAHNQFKCIRRGLEKESLRVDKNGTLAQTPHPSALGSALTHPSIITDYSESLLEFVTSVHTDVPALLSQLKNIHNFTYRNIDDEKLWVNSMPCVVENENKIPIARYGTSNIAKMKEAYRNGLSNRYGALMQTIAGIHFNFSLPEDYWQITCSSDSKKAIQSHKSKHYFSLIRNFHRHSWISQYLFGASPAVCRSFLDNRKHTLQQFDDNSYYLPYATSLRMSGLGYNNESQTNIAINYNSVEKFVMSLRKVMNTNYSPYKKIGIKKDSMYQQLNSNLIQIENEFYSSIRPKRITPSGQSPSRTLKEQGVEYVEIRNIDLNPFFHLGIDEHTIHFLDLFLMYCLYSDSPFMSQHEYLLTQANQQTIAIEGRKPNITIKTLEGGYNAIQKIKEIVKEIKLIAEFMDDLYQTTKYRTSVEMQEEKIRNPGNTPSAKILETMRASDMSFYEFSMSMSEATEQYFKSQTLDSEIDRQFKTQAVNSLEKQTQIENQDAIDFDSYLKQYFEQQNAPFNCQYI